MRRAVLICALLLLAAQAQETGKLSARAEVRRRYLWIGADGRLAGIASGTALTARVKRGDASALEQPATVGADGTLHVEIRTTARLLPDEYTLEVAQGTTPLARALFRVGSPDEVEPAREKLRTWLRTARSALRDLTAYLERHASFHRRRLLDAAKNGMPGRRLVEAQSNSWTASVDRFALRYRTARMDFLPYEREVLLSPFPEAGAALSELFPALQARRDELKRAFDEALAGRSPNVAAPEKILEIARRSAKGLSFEADDLDAWSAGPLGVPETGKLENGHFTSVLGASLDVPAGWEVLDRATYDDDNPEERIFVDGPEGIRFSLMVRELPDMKSLDDLERTVEAFAWEEWGNTAYKKLEAVKGERSYELHARCTLGGKPFRLLLVDKAPREGRRLFELRARCPEAVFEGHKAELEKLAASFTLDEKK